MAHVHGLNPDLALRGEEVTPTVSRGEGE